MVTRELDSDFFFVVVVVVEAPALLLWYCVVLLIRGVAVATHSKQSPPPSPSPSPPSVAANTCAQTRSTLAGPCSLPRSEKSASGRSAHTPRSVRTDRTSVVLVVVVVDGWCLDYQFEEEELHHHPPAQHLCTMLHPRNTIYDSV